MSDDDRDGDVCEGYPEHEDIDVRGRDMAIMTAAAQRRYWRAELRARLLDDGADDVLPITPGSRNRAELLALLDDADRAARIPRVEVEYEPGVGWRADGLIWATDITAMAASVKAAESLRAAGVWRAIADRVDEVKRDRQVRDLTGVFVEAAGFIATMSEQKVTTNMLHAGVRAVLDELGVEAE